LLGSGLLGHVSIPHFFQVGFIYYNICELRLEKASSKQDGISFPML
jgi:hypothetical protein